MKRKGFTLTEVLVVVVILGIISGLSIPLIRNLSTTFEKKKYETYADTVTASAKLYTDSYSEDMFGRKEYGCGYITYDNLIDKGLLKDINIDNVSCDSDKTFVRVIKQKDKYSYRTYLGCGVKENNNVVVATRYPEGTLEEINYNSCTGSNPNNINISVDTTEIGGEYDKKKKSTKILLSSGTGIYKNASISTAWSKDPNGFNDVSKWTKASFEIKGNQEEKLLNGDLISTKSNKLSTPKDSGDMYLLVRVDSLMDLYGNNWVNNLQVGGAVAATSDNYISYGPFRIDNDNPTITLDLYACGSNGEKTGNKIATKTSDGSESNIIITTKDMVGSDDKWLNKQTFPYGVCIDMALSDGVKVKKLEMEQNDSNLAVNAANYKDIKDSNEYTIGEKNANKTTSILDNGHRYFVYTAKDYVGNESSIAVDIKLDNTPPTINCTKSNTGSTSGVTITVSCTDSVSGCKNSTDIGPHYSITSNQTYNGEDNAGNTNSCSASVSSSNCNCTTNKKSCPYSAKCSCRCTEYHVSPTYCATKPGYKFVRTDQSSSSGGSGWLGTCTYDGCECPCTKYYDCSTTSCSTCYS